ncbi:ABC transporter permease [Salipaludibacillus daqingensis]|uniref:ABC transporter permease n=1 Tax=Salipaludibacillus daqingensis TaxID=3041001 RepID=UPI002473AE9A|nr:ABC transporter permease subunit [Salipaludibacillus daqingensis]
MGALLKNEWIKLWNKKQTWFFLGAIVIIMIGLTFIYQSFIADSTNQGEGEWTIELETEISEQEEILESGTDEEWMEAQAEQTIQENEELLEAGINPNEMNNMIFMNETVLSVASFITLFTVIVASSIVSSEIDNGTMKHLLIRPYERWQVLLSKFITVVAFSIVMMVTLILTNILMGTIFFGTGSYSSQVMEMSFHGGPLYTTVANIFPAKIGLYFLNMLMFVIISFSLSILFKSQTLAVGISIFILFSTSVLQGFSLLLADTAWYKFIFLPHLDLPAYAVVDEIMPGVGIGFSLTILAIYAIAFIGASGIYFQKKDLM